MAPEMTEQCEPKINATTGGKREVRAARVPVRFAIGDLRLLTVELAVREVYGHFLECPVSLDELIAAYDEGGGAAVLGRSIILSELSQKLADRRQLEFRVLAEYNRHYVALRGSFKDYLAHFSSRSRSTLTRKVRKFQAVADGTIDWATFRTPAEVTPFLDEALPLSARTYQQKLFGSGIPDTDEFRGHLRQLAEKDCFRGWLLRLHGSVIAYICSEGVGRTLLYEYVGFDAASADLSPGTVLQYLVLEQLFDEGSFAYFDFTEGEGGHKEFFGTDSRHCGDVLITGHAFGSKLLFAAHRSFNGASRVLVAGVDALGLKSRLRRLLRRGS